MHLCSFSLKVFVVGSFYFHFFNESSDIQNCGVMEMWGIGARHNNWFWIWKKVYFLKFLFSLPC